MADQARSQKRQKQRVALVGFGLLALLPVTGLLLSGYARVREASDGVT
jgi:hypothetical protein